MGWFILVMAAGLTAVVLLVAESEYDAVDDRANRGIEQDAEEFRQFVVAGVDPATGRFLGDPEFLLRQHLAAQHTGDAELLIGVLPTPAGHRTLHQGANGAMVAGLPIERMVGAPEATGVLPTEAGELRWVRVDGGKCQPKWRCGPNGTANRWSPSPARSGAERGKPMTPASTPTPASWPLRST